LGKNHPGRPSTSDVGQVFAFEMEADRFADVRGQLIQGGSLSHNGEVQAFGYELALAFRDADLDSSLQHHRLRL
jgi:hypothetical protein